ncbi:MAG: FecR family protein, partial [Bacteroidota bacterium]|nr:FecR family protein [Bacteroidota bacterium]
MENESINFDDLIIRYLSGNTTQSENQVLSEWMNESTDNRSTFNAIRNIWLATSQTSDIVSALHSVHDIPESPNNSDKDLDEDLDESPVHKSIGLKNILKVAAVIVITLAIGALGNQLWVDQLKNVPSKKTVNFETSLGSRASTTLPDGSKVWLNAGSRLDYNLDFGNKTRIVKLTGEAFFDVKTDSLKPFIVKAGKLAIKAYGTAFNVKAY